MNIRVILFSDACKTQDYITSKHSENYKKISDGFNVNRYIDTPAGKLKVFYQRHDSQGNRHEKYEYGYIIEGKLYGYIMLDSNLMVIHSSKCHFGKEIIKPPVADGTWCFG